MLPVNIHAKVGIVDDKWATVGSANLDYASMDRAIEVNANLLGDADPEDPSDIVSILRRKLWAEHLGFFNSYQLEIVSIHEAFPGHYYQFLRLKEVPSLVRTLMAQATMICWIAS